MVLNLHPVPGIDDVPQGEGPATDTGALLLALTDENDALRIKVGELIEERDRFAAALVEAAGGDAPAELRDALGLVAARLEAHVASWLRPGPDVRKAIAGNHLAGAARDAASLLRSIGKAANPATMLAAE